MKTRSHLLEESFPALGINSSENLQTADQKGNIRGVWAPLFCTAHPPLRRLPGSAPGSGGICAEGGASEMGVRGPTLGLLGEWISLLDS